MKRHVGPTEPANWLDPVRGRVESFCFAQRLEVEEQCWNSLAGNKCRP